MTIPRSIGLITFALCALIRALEDSSPGFDNGSLGDNNTQTLLGGDDVITVATNTTEPSAVEQSFLNGFLSALSMIITSELLDKTFFIAVVMAMRHPRLTVYSGAMTALALMTVLSATVGLLTTFIPRWITVYASAALMLVFGLKMFYDAFRMTAQKGQEEYEEVEKEVEQREKDENDRLLESGSDASIPAPKEPTAFRTFLKIFVETFVLTFLAEWGDRSQVATVLLAATDNVLGVLVGGVLGHAICTGAAVLGGKFVANHVTVRMVTVLGGIVFIIFAVLSVVLYKLNPTSA